MKKHLLAICFILLAMVSWGQILKPVVWSFSSEPINEREAYIVIRAKIDKGWHVYSQFIEDGGPIPTSFIFNKTSDFDLIGKVTETPKAKAAFDPNFSMDISWHEDLVVFKQKVALKKPELKISGTLEYMACDDKQCLPPAEVEFTINVKTAGISAQKNIQTKVQATTPNEDVLPETAFNDTSSTSLNASKDDKSLVIINDKANSKSLWAIFLGGFIGGLLALIMPCIFPMLPLTISFFTKKAGSRRKAVGQATLYGLFIILIYVALGMLITLIFGSDALNEMASSGFFNLLFFLLLVIFAISFLGAFEITLPSSWVNKIDAKSDKGGLIGLFFMAFALVLVSFSCTGPIIGTLLVQAASMGELMGPTVGMFGFSLALAIPFSLFAAFPSLLKSLPQSGGWLNSVKVVLGFIELALAFKFLSNVDLAYHWNLLDREIFLAIWIIIFGLLGFYLLGKLQFSHDSELSYLPVSRLFLAIGVLAFTLYMIPGLWGAPLKSISAWLPPQTTQDFDLYTNTLSSPSENKGIAKKYAGLFEAPHNLNAFFDYEEGLAYAKTQNKPVLIDFTGHSCVNCRKMEAQVWSDPRVLKRLNEDYVLVSLYVDDKTRLSEEEQYTSSFSGKNIKTIGNKWSDFQASTYQTNSQPYYVIVNNEGKLLVKPESFNLDIENYINFLDSGKAAYQNN